MEGVRPQGRGLQRWQNVPSGGRDRACCRQGAGCHPGRFRRSLCPRRFAARDVWSQHDRSHTAQSLLSEGRPWQGSDELPGTDDFFSCIWCLCVLKFGYSTCGYVAFDGLRQVFAAFAVAVCVSADNCVRALFLEACKYLLQSCLGVSSPRSPCSVGTEVCPLPRAITRRHAWEMNDCRWSDRVATAEEIQAGYSRRPVCRGLGSPAIATTARHSQRGAGAVTGQGGLWFAVGVSSNESVNTGVDACPGRVRKGGGNPKSRA